MEKAYLDFVLKGMDPMFDAVHGPYDRQLIMAGTMSRFLNCDSLLYLSKTYDINKDSLYQAFDAITPPRWLRRLVKRGRRKLVDHLRKWHAGDPSFKSRHATTLCADDSTRTARGYLGGWTGLFYSGAEKGVVHGINVEALVAVIGDGLEVIILDVRIVPSDPDGGGRHPLNQNQWLRRALRQVNAFLGTKATHLQGCALAVDAAYVSPENVALAKDLGMQLVSKLSANRIVTGEVSGPITANVGYFAGLSLFTHHRPCRALRGEEGVEFQRNTVYVPSLDTTVIMVTFIHEWDFQVYFSTNPSMKTITLRNIIRYRWQLERVFWILKQDIGIGDIHHQKENRVESRIYLHFILAQVPRDAAAVFKCFPKDIMRGIRRSPDLVLHELGFPSAFANELLEGSVLHGRQAA